MSHAVIIKSRKISVPCRDAAGNAREVECATLAQGLMAAVWLDMLKAGPDAAGAAAHGRWHRTATECIRAHASVVFWRVGREAQKALGIQP